MTKIQVLTNELKDMKVLYDKGYMSNHEYTVIAARINQEIEMELTK